MSNGNFILDLTIKFKNKNEEGLINEVKKAHSKISLDGSIDVKTVYIMTVICMTIGVYDDKKLSDKEKDFLAKVFPKIYNIEMLQDGIDSLYEQIIDFDKEDVLEHLKRFLSGFPEFAMPLLKMILAFACCDGECKETTVSNLENIFGIYLLANFFKGELDDDADLEQINNDLDNEINYWNTVLEEEKAEEQPKVENKIEKSKSKNVEKKTKNQEHLIDKSKENTESYFSRMLEELEESKEEENKYWEDETKEIREKVSKKYKEIEEKVRKEVEEDKQFYINANKKRLDENNDLISRIKKEIKKKQEELDNLSSIRFLKKGQLEREIEQDKETISELEIEVSNCQKFFDNIDENYKLNYEYKYNKACLSSVYKLTDIPMSPDDAIKRFKEIFELHEKLPLIDIDLNNYDENDCRKFNMETIFLELLKHPYGMSLQEMIDERLTISLRDKTEALEAALEDLERLKVIQKTNYRDKEIYTVGKLRQKPDDYHSIKASFTHGLYFEDLRITYYYIKEKKQIDIDLVDYNDLEKMSEEECISPKMLREWNKLRLLRYLFDLETRDIVRVRLVKDKKYYLLFEFKTEVKD